MTKCYQFSLLEKRFLHGRSVRYALRLVKRTPVHPQDFTLTANGLKFILAITSNIFLTGHFDN